MSSRFLRRLDRDAFPMAEYGAQFLHCGESAIVLGCRVPAGGAGPSHHLHERSDQIYHVLEGELHVQLGSEVVVASPGTTLLIPKGTPHHNWNEGAEHALHFEVIVPPPRPDLPLGTATDESGPGECPFILNRLAELAREEALEGFGIRRALERANGSMQASLYVADVAPGAGGPPTHVHRFDQFYYVLEGEMTAEIGLDRIVARPHDLVVLPAMVPHRQYNEGVEAERHLTLLVPEPPAGEPLDVAVEFAGVGEV